MQVKELLFLQCIDNPLIVGVLVNLICRLN